MLRCSWLDRMIEWPNRGSLLAPGRREHPIEKKNCLPNHHPGLRKLGFLLLQGRNTSTREKVLFMLNEKLRLPLPHMLRLLVLLNQQTEKSVTVPAEVFDPNYQT